MSERAAAELLGAHRALSGPDAELWHQVALGLLSPDEAARLQLERQPEMSEEGRAALERATQVFAPRSAEEQQARLEALLAQRAAEAAAVVVPMRARRAEHWAVALVAAAAAVMLTVWLVPSRPGGVEGAFPGGYAIELEKAAVAMRGAEPQAEVPTFLLDGKISIRLVPEQAVEGPLEVMAYAWGRSEPARRLTLEPMVHDNGVVVLDTTVKALGLHEGEWELVIAIGWAEALPSSWEALVETEASGSTRLEVVRARLKVVTRLSEHGGDE